MNRIPASFRDPSGYVFRKDEQIYRTVNECYRENYDLLMSELYGVLVGKKYLIPHEEVEPSEFEYAYKIIKSVEIPFITYPYEWSFSQLKDASLLTLKIQLIALKHDMVLKDASAYNVQFYEGKPIFIDTLSFEKYQEWAPWIAYKQFCQHFLAPLVLMSYSDVRLNQLLKTNIDGIPLDLANKLLPLKHKLRPSVFFNISMQSSFQKKYESKDIDFKKKSKISKEQLMSMNCQLQDVISELKFPTKSTEWGEYYTFTNYNDRAFQDKKTIVEDFISRANPKSLWDLGANNGFFTRLASSRNINTLAFDIDPIACEKNYLDIKSNNEKNILPVLFDLTNPSPSIGWGNSERGSILERTKPDMLMALALVHHLAISNNIPLVNIAEYFSTLARHLIIEFVPKADTQVQKLLATREDIFVNYTTEHFEKEFSIYYNILEKRAVKETERTLYLMEGI